MKILSLAPRHVVDKEGGAPFRMAWEERIFGKGFLKEHHTDLGLVRCAGQDYYASLYEEPNVVQ